MDNLIGGQKMAHLMENVEGYGFKRAVSLASLFIAAA